MYKRFLGIIISCMMIIAPLSVFAETGGYAEGENVILPSVEASLTTEVEKEGTLVAEPIVEESVIEEVITTEESITTEIDVNSGEMQLRVPASRYPFQAMYPMELISRGDGGFK